MSTVTFRKTIGLATVAWLLIAAPFTFAQTTNASLGGTVSDGSGALIPGVSVSARNVGTGIVNESITNEAGAYQFPNLQNGTYEVSAELVGFRTQRFANVALGVSQQVRLNFRLEIGDISTTIDVTAAADTTLATTSASIGTVLADVAVRELPLGDRNVLELLSGMGGTGPTEGTLDGYFAGGRLSATNLTRDGLVISAGRYNQGVLGVTYMSPDLVEEVRITTGTVDAESGRGSGQVQMVTRSGTNALRGSAFWNNRNSMFSATNWFNNFNRVNKDWSNRNQFGVRMGGPIIQNKTFFFFLIDEQRDVTKENFVGTVLTPQARQGIYRYFPGANNENAQQNSPVVDLNGNPVRPGAATGDLQSINLFSRDPNRPGYDPSGWVQQVLLARMPMPNDYTVGDGLNTAGIRFTRRIYGFDNNTQELVDRNNRDQFNMRLDHNFNASNKMSFVYTYERAIGLATTAGIQQWPNGYNGANSKFPRIYNLSFVSTVSNMVNEFRAGYRLHHVGQWAPFYKGLYRGEGELTESAKEAFAQLPKSNGFQYQPQFSYYGQSFMNFTASWASTRGSYSPLLAISDTLSWQRGTHSFKVGFEGRRDRTMGWNDTNMTPIVTIGAGNFPAPIETNTPGIVGLTSSNATVARNILYNLAGSIDNVRQGFDLRSTSDTKFKGMQDGVMAKIRDWRLGEMSTFFKDDWKISTNLTLNLGLQWEWYGSHYEQRGIAGTIVDGYKGLCGISCGALTQLAFAGKNSPNPKNQLRNNDFNNFAPNVGFSYSVPGLGRRTIVRGGYGVHYAGKEYLGPSWIDLGAGTLPGLSGGFGCCGLTYTQPTYWNMANLRLPFEPKGAPLQPVALTNDRTLQMNMYEKDRPIPYIQNFTLSVQQELATDFLLDVSYIGTKATKLYGYVDLNYQKIFETPFLEAFNVTRAGGNHPLFDRMLMGLTLPGAGGPVNGTTVTGSAALRLYSQTRTLLANGSAGGVADFLNRSTSVTGQAGGFIRNGGLPEDFLVFNPQFQIATLQGNPGNSNYHSLQVNFTKRFSRGFSNQTSYTWSKTLGIGDSENTVTSRNPRDRNADRSVVAFHRSQVFTSSGTLSLPFGPERKFLSSAPGWVQRFVEQWQMGAILRLSSGAPLTITSGTLSNIYDASNNTPNIFGVLPEGKVTKGTDGRLPTYFEGLRQGTAGSDPGRAAVTTANTLQSAYNLRAIFDASGNPLLVNPEPGKVGTLGVRTVTGPSRAQFDANLVKRVRIDERREFEFRADVTNVLNHPVFDNPNLDINSASFGRISSASDGRKVVLGARLNF